MECLGGLFGNLKGCYAQMDIVVNCFRFLFKSGRQSVGFSGVSGGPGGFGNFREAARKNNAPIFVQNGLDRAEL